MGLLMQGVKDFWRRQESMAIRLLGLLVISAGLATFAAAAQTLEVTANIQVSEHWRGAYDILVRPQSSISEVERETGLVEGNYLGTPLGGITRDQFELIKQIEGVEVAAPVAAIGFMLNDTGSIGVGLEDSQADMLYKISIELLIRGGQLPESRHWSAYFGAPSDSAQNRIYFKGSRDLIGTPGGLLMVPTIGSLPAMWTLIAGIDAEQETKLVGLEQAVSGRTLPMSGDLHELLIPSWGGQLETAVSIPILVSEHPFLVSSVSITMQQVPVEDRETWRRLIGPEGPSDDTIRAEREQALAELDLLFGTPQSQIVIEETVDLDEIIQPLAGFALLFRPTQTAQAAREGGLSPNLTDLMLYPGPIEYAPGLPPREDTNQSVFVLSSLGSWDEIVLPQMIALDRVDPWVYPEVDVPEDSQLFRPLTAYAPPRFQFNVLGTYDFERLNASDDPLSYVPLGIYEPPLAILRYDEMGNAVEPRVLTPGLNPAGFIPRPPLALTTLEAAEFLLGKEDFVNAVRVRVADIEGYTPENIARVERVASEIAERTGLHVDIVAGSSPQKVLVLVPGLGYVEEQWTTLGAALQITSGINAANLILLGCLLLASALFIANGAQLSTLSRREEIGLLKAIGWRTRHILRMLMGSWLFIGVVGALLSAAASIILTLALGLRANWPVIVLTSLAAPTLYLLCAWLPARRAARWTPAHLLRQGERSAFERLRSLPLGLNLIGLAVRQLWRKRMRSLLMMLIVAAGVALIVLLVNILSHLQGMLHVTLLGEHIAFTVRPYHQLMAIVALAVAALATLESLLAGVLERAGEFGLLSAVGWRSRHLSLEVIWEGCMLGALGGLLGGLAGAAIFWCLTGELPITTWLVAGIGAALAALLGVLASLYPARQASLQMPAQVLSGPEELRALAPGRASPLRWMGSVLAIAVFLAAVAVFGGRMSVVERAIGLGGSPEPTPHPAMRAVSGERALEHARNLAEFGPRAFGNQAEAFAAEYVAQELQSYGLQIAREPLLLSAFTFYDAQGEPQMHVPRNGGYSRGIVAAMAGVQAGQAISGPVSLVSPEEAWLAAQEIQDKVLIIVEEDPTQQATARLRDLITHYGTPAPYLAAVVVTPANPDAFEALLTSDGSTVSIAVSENIIAVLPGEVRPEEEIWIVAHYDSSPESPGADAGASGIGVMLELARIFAERGSPVTLRFMAMSGSETGREGIIDYLTNHEADKQNVLGVIEFDQVGNWDTLTLGQDIDALTWNHELFDPETIEQFRREGMSFLKPNWIRRLDLDRPGLLAWLDQELAHSGGLAESPPGLIETTLATAQSLDLNAAARAFACSGQTAFFLYRQIPAILVCGADNGLANSPFDSADTLRAEALGQAAAFGYQLILNLSLEAGE